MRSSNNAESVSLRQVRFFIPAIHPGAKIAQANEAGVGEIMQKLASLAPLKARKNRLDRCSEKAARLELPGGHRRRAGDVAMDDGGSNTAAPVRLGRPGKARPGARNRGILRGAGGEMRQVWGVG